MPDHPSEPDRSVARDARPAPRRGCPRCGAPLGALRADAGSEESGSESTVESLYCGCCGLVVPAAPAA